ncbi:hypothetical protein [Kibdelosporangium philippinense]|uniref:hypothetical protein n=1 Tax=Kibdelosporangium philippinense TaxID=211113 RepID=UPI0036222D03
MVILPLSSLVGTRKDHAVAVPYGDATPPTSGNVVHHLSGHNHRESVVRQPS